MAYECRRIVTGHTPEGKSTVLYDSSMPLLEADNAAGAGQKDRAGAVGPRPQPHLAIQGAAAADIRIFQRIGAADAPRRTQRPHQPGTRKIRRRPLVCAPAFAESGPELDVTATAGYRGQVAMIPSAGPPSATPPPRPNGCSVCVGSQMPISSVGIPIRRSVIVRANNNVPACHPKRPRGALTEPVVAHLDCGR